MSFIKKLIHINVENPPFVVFQTGVPHLVAAAASRAAAGKPATASAALISSQPMPEAWCSIAYFELDTQVRAWTPFQTMM